MRFRLRSAEPSDQEFLVEMLFESLFVEPGDAPFERSILLKPEISRYAENWGREGDFGLIAEDDSGRPIGACWARLFPADAPGYGFVMADTPELGMAVVPDWRGQGVGTALLELMLESSNLLYPGLSLSVFAQNPAARLYNRLGFSREGGTDSHPTLAIWF